MFEGTSWERQTWLLQKKDLRIFVDTCSLIWIEEHNLDTFWDNMCQLVRGGAQPLIIAYGVYAELKKHSSRTQGSSEERALAAKSQAALDRLARMQQQGVIRLMGDSNEKFADNVFQTVFTQYRMKYNLLLITQDNNLSKDILSLNNSVSVERKKEIYVRRISEGGNLRMFYFDPHAKSQPDESPSARKGAQREGSQHGKEGQPFRIVHSVTAMPDDCLPLSEEADEGSRLLTDAHEAVRLGKKLGQGGEGTVYRVSDQTVAKIYDRRHLTRWRFEKLKRMVQHKLSYQGLCWPTHLLYNEAQEFVGFLMPMAKGRPLRTSVCHKIYQQKYFPDWKKRDMIQLSLTILEKIRYLHDHNVIMGDINLMNILVASPTEAYFVDTDSYQIEEFPCPVGTINFTAPEIQGLEYSSFLRTMGNENFAVATLLFMLMLPGKAPYSQQGGESGSEDIRAMQFPYAYEENTTGTTPQGAWRFIWSHMAKKIKQAFYETFMRGQPHSQERTRYSVQEWISKFRTYQVSLEKYMLANDPMSGELYPTRLKHVANDQGKQDRESTNLRQIPQRSYGGQNFVDAETARQIEERMAERQHQREDFSWGWAIAAAVSFVVCCKMVLH